MVKFYSDKTQKWYDSAAEAVKAEELHDKKLEEEKAKKVMYEEMLAKVADRLALVEAKLK